MDEEISKSIVKKPKCKYCYHEGVVPLKCETIEAEFKRRNQTEEKNTIVVKSIEAVKPDQ